VPRIVVARAPGERATTVVSGRSIHRSGALVVSFAREWMGRAVIPAGLRTAGLSTAGLRTAGPRSGRDLVRLRWWADRTGPTLGYMEPTTLSRRRHVDLCRTSAAL
jgi:hypothetical protein